MVESYPALLAGQFPIVVVGGVDASGIYAPYSQGLAHELTVSAVGRVFCADRQGGASVWTGTSFGGPLFNANIIRLSPDGIGYRVLATPAVAGLAAYLLSLDQYRGRLMVQGSVARNVRDLIKSLAYGRQPLQPAVVWNGIDSRQIACPVRRDIGSSGCPARNTTLPNFPPATRPPSRKSATTVTPSSSNPSSIPMTTSSSNPFKPSESSIVTDLSTTSSESFMTLILTISPGVSTEIVTISEVGVRGLVVATNAPQA